MEIKKYIKNNGAEFDDSVTYDVTPVVPTEPGKLSQSTKDSALAILNNYRFIAGLSSVTWYDDKDESQQAACLVNAANGGISHYPSQPDGMDETIYNLGYSGCGESNLSAGRSTLNKSIALGWMADSDSSNIDRVGHRRWCLNPGMKKVSFGAVTNASGGYHNYYSMYAFDGAFDGGTTTVAWPAQVTPIEYFDSSSAWSLSLGKTLNADDIEVTVKQKGGRTWTFNSESSDGYFNVNNQNYGQKGCIIFKPSGITYSDGSEFTVTVTGLENTIQYTVSFFSLS